MRYADGFLQGFNSKNRSVKEAVRETPHNQGPGACLAAVLLTAGIAPKHAQEIGDFPQMTEGLLTDRIVDVP